MRVCLKSGILTQELVDFFNVKLFCIFLHLLGGNGLSLSKLTFPYVVAKNVRSPSNGDLVCLQ